MPSTDHRNPGHVEKLRRDNARLREALEAISSDAAWRATYPGTPRILLSVELVAAVALEGK